MKATEVDEETLIEVLSKAEEKIKSLKTKVKAKRLQDARLAKFAAMAIQGFCANPEIAGIGVETITPNDIAQMAVVQAKALIDALNEEGE